MVLGEEEMGPSGVDVALDSAGESEKEGSWRWRRGTQSYRNWDSLLTMQ